MTTLRHRTVRFAVVVALAAIAWQIFLAVGASRRLDAALAADLDRQAYVNIAVTLGFPPEDFHIRVFQTHGIVSGVKGTTVWLDRVTPGDVRQIARYYWVQHIVERGLGSSSVGPHLERSRS